MPNFTSPKTKADITKAFEQHERYLAGEQGASPIQFKGVNLSNQYMQDMDLTHATFVDCIFTGVQLKNIHFHHTRMLNCQLNYASFEYCSGDLLEIAYGSIDHLTIKESNIKHLTLRALTSRHVSILMSQLDGLKIDDCVFGYTHIHDVHIFGLHIKLTHFDGIQATSLCIEIMHLYTSYVTASTLIRSAIQFATREENAINADKVVIHDTHFIGMTCTNNVGFDAVSQSRQTDKSSDKSEGMLDITYVKPFHLYFITSSESTRTYKRDELMHALKNGEYAKPHAHMIRSFILENNATVMHVDN